MLREHLLDIRLLERQRQISQVQIGGILLLLLSGGGEEIIERERGGKEEEKME